MDEKQIEIFFNMAERPVKLLLNSYFELFKKEKKLDICEQIGVSTKRFPESYTKHGDLVSLINTGEISDKFLQHESMLKIPIKMGEIKININDDVYLLFLDIVPFDKLWDETIFEPFENIDPKKNQISLIKNYIGQIMNMAQFVFACLKKNNDNELNTILLEADPNNITLKIKDIRIPNYNHPLRIGFKIIKEILNIKN